MPTLPQASPNIVGMSAQCVIPAANEIVVFTSYEGTWRGPLAEIPHSHKHVLENRKLIGIVARVVQQLLHQGGRDRGIAKGTFNGFPPLVAGHARDEILAAIQRLR